jgi:hypothetical protein
LQQVCEFANSGCVMFVVQLGLLLEAKGDSSFLIDGRFREFYEYAYNRRLQLLYPLRPSYVPRESNDLILNIGWSPSTPIAILNFTWERKDDQKELNLSVIRMFSLEGGPLVLFHYLTQILTSFRRHISRIYIRPTITTQS